MCVIKKFNLTFTLESVSDFLMHNEKNRILYMLKNIRIFKKYSK